MLSDPFVGVGGRLLKHELVRGASVIAWFASPVSMRLCLNYSFSKGEMPTTKENITNIDRVYAE